MMNGHSSLNGVPTQNGPLQNFGDHMRPPGPESLKMAPTGGPNQPYSHIRFAANGPAALGGNQVPPISQNRASFPPAAPNAYAGGTQSYGPIGSVAQTTVPSQQPFPSYQGQAPQSQTTAYRPMPPGVQAQHGVGNQMPSGGAYSGGPPQPNRMPASNQPQYAAPGFGGPRPPGQQQQTDRQGFAPNFPTQQQQPSSAYPQQQQVGAAGHMSRPLSPPQAGGFTQPSATLQRPPLPGGPGQMPVYNQNSSAPPAPGQGGQWAPSQMPGMPPQPPQQQSLSQRMPFPPGPGVPGGSNTSLPPQVPMPGHMQPGPPGVSSFPPQAPGMAAPYLAGPAGSPPGAYSLQSGQGPPGYPQQPQGPGAYPQQAPARKLDPNAMPSVVQVTEDDRSRSGPFPTGFPRAEQPPLVTTEIVAEDQGNCSPAFMRSTVYHIPISSDLLKQSSIPLGLCITPFARQHLSERPPPLIDMGELGPVRCQRCKAYMCPYMEFNDGGRRFRCPFCRANSDVPELYFAHLDHTGRRTDLYARPELFLGSYDFVATKMYCKNGIFPKPPAFVFMLDVSYNAARCGLISLFCQHIKDLLHNLPTDGYPESAIEVGFATYDQTVHFYNLKASTSQPKMMTVVDMTDVFVPLGEGFFVKPKEAVLVLDSLLQQIPQMFADNKTTEIVFGPVVKAGMEALTAADRSGKVFVFHTSLPLYDAPGKLKNRDDRKLLGTDKERQLLAPIVEYYGDLAKECVAVGCSVDAFLFTNAYIDIATIGSLCGTTGGQVYKYAYFQADVDGSRFLDDLRRDIEQPIIFDCLMKVRTSTGIRATDFYGNFFMSNSTDVEIAAMDCHKAITVELKYDDKLDEKEGAFIQMAILFTSASGQRRLRIHNLAMNVGTELAQLYRSADLDTIVNFLAKQSERLLFNKSPRDVREQLVSHCSKILATYRSKVSQSAPAGQLILPEGMKLLPLYTNCIIRHAAFSAGSEVNTDDKSWLMQVIPSMRVIDSVAFFYPRMVPLMPDEDGLNLAEDELPIAARCFYENLQPNSAYFLENGIVMFLWLGMAISSQWLMDVFGVNSLSQLNPEQHDIPDKDNATSRRVRAIFNKLREQRPRSMKLYVVHQQHKLEAWFKIFLVEDKGADNNAPGYVDFLCHIHKEIRNLLE